MFIRLLCTAVLLIAASTLAAQSIPHGTRIRVSLNVSPERSLVGIADSLKNGRLTWRPEGDSSLTLPLTAISALEMSQGRHSRAGTGAVVGGGIGVLAGAASFVALENMCLLSCNTTGGSDNLAAGLTGAALGGMVGAGLGALFGTAFHSEKWEALQLSSLQVAAVSFNRFGVGITLRF